MKKEKAQPKEKTLSKEDLLILELEQEKLKNATLNITVLQLQDKIEELAILNIQLQTQIKVQELQIKRKDKEKDIKKAILKQSEVGRKLEEVKSEIGKRVGIKDWKTIVYDDITGRVTEI